MKTTHTTGNWHAHDGQIYPEETGKTLALIPYFDKDNEEQKANARLIAASPDMLEALRNLIEKCLRTADTTLMHEELFNAQEAIQKATQP